MNDKIFYIFVFFGIGLFSSAHCFGMCGGIFNALSLAVGKNKIKKSFIYYIIYNIGRVTAYVIMCIFFSFLGSTIENLIPDSTYKLIRVFTGILFIFIGLFSGNFLYSLKIFEYMEMFLWKSSSYFIKLIIPVNNFFKTYILGIIWGCIPCGLTYSIIVLAIINENLFYSVILIIFFGLGTFPVMIISVTIFSNFFKIVNINTTRRIAGFFIILFGMWTFVSGMYTLIH